MKIAKKYPKRFFQVFIILVSLHSYAQTKEFSNFELSSVHSNAYYYNLDKFNGKLYLGSDRGIFEFINQNKISLIDSKKRGYIYTEKGKLTCLDFFKIGYSTPQFNYLLPESYRNSSIVGIAIENVIVVVSKGHLFVFIKKPKTIADSLSIRSLSQNFIGSYNGVFYKNKSIPFISYTNGYIREFDNEVFVCQDGLTRIKNNKITLIENEKEIRQFIGLKDLDKFRDIVKINEDNYLIFTLNGIIKSNLKGRSSWIYKNSSKGEPRVITLKLKEGTSDLKEVIFTQNNKAFSLHVENENVAQILEIDSKFGEIKDLAYQDLGKIFLITEDKLMLYKLDSDNNYSGEILENNLLGNHQLIWLENYFIITSNSGLSSFNTNNDEFKRIFLRDEFNDKAYFKSADSLKLGTPHGFYSFSNKELITLINNYKPNEDFVIEERNDGYYLPFLLSCCLLIATLLTLLIINLFKRKSIQEPQNLSRKKIIDYIDRNLNKVTVFSVAEHFNSNLNLINKELEDIRIGELIRERRINVVRKMRKDLRKEEDISLVTGFSISYLRKIK